MHVGVGSYDDAVIRARAGFTLSGGKDRGVWASVSASHSAGTSLANTLTASPGSPRTASKVDAFDAVGGAGRAWWGPLTLQWFVHSHKETVPVGAYDTAYGDPRTAFTDTRMMAELRYEPKLGRHVELMTRLHGNRYVFHWSPARATSRPACTSASAPTTTR